LPNNQIIQGIKDIEKGKIALAENFELRKRVDSLETLNKLLKKDVSAFEKNEGLYKQVVKSYDKTDSANHVIIQLKADLANSLERDLKNQKTKTWVTGGFGIALTVAALLLKR